MNAIIQEDGLWEITNQKDKKKLLIFVKEGVLYLGPKVINPIVMMMIGKPILIVGKGRKQKAFMRAQDIIDEKLDCAKYVAPLAEKWGLKL